MRREPELKARRHGRWAQVYAEVDGTDVSRLGYASHKLQIGREALVKVAGIGGVSTEPAHRRQGLAKKVIAHAFEEMDREGYTTAGLYTTRRIVAHRLYRRLGFVDVARRQQYCKLLDPGASAQQMLSELVLRSPELRSRRITLALNLNAVAPIYLLIEGNDVRVLARAPRSTDLSLTMTQETLVGLRFGDLSPRYAETARLLGWRGDAAIYHALSSALSAQQNPVHEG